MHYYSVAPNKLIRRDSYHFAYHSNEQILPGTLVKIPMGKSSAYGIVLEEVKQPAFDTRAIDRIINQEPIQIELVKTALWIAKYYQVHESAALALLIPRGVEKKRRPRDEQIVESSNIIASPTRDQQKAIDSILEMTETTGILHGVTGSGKTLVYIKLAEEYLKSGKSSIILVPEITLTSQLLESFARYFKSEQLIVNHSKQTEAERHLTWQSTLESKEPRIYIGPRSTLFLPINDIGMIAVDESHEPSYRQDTTPKYSTLRVATILARNHRAKAVFGSATPSVAEYYAAKQAKAPIIKLDNTAKKSTKPNISIIDSTKRDNFIKHRFLSITALNEIDKALENNEQVLVYHNRRGSARIVMCQSCGWMAVDPSNQAPLTLHADKHMLISHLTGYTTKVPTSCPDCSSSEIIFKGYGTKMLESELNKLYPDKTIGRYDGDSLSNETLEKQYDSIVRGDVNIIIGTQVVAKGLDLPLLSTVIITQADAGLALPDYTARERTFQLIAQAIGRVGRSDKKTSVVVQTFQPDNSTIKQALAQDYEAFYEQEINLRSKAGLPPHRFMSRFVCTYKQERTAIKNSRELISVLRKNGGKSIEILGPAPLFHDRQETLHKWQIIVKSKSRQKLLDLADYMPKNGWVHELDPINLL